MTNDKCKASTKDIAAECLTKAFVIIREEITANLIQEFVHKSTVELKEEISELYYEKSMRKSN